MKKHGGVIFIIISALSVFSFIAAIKHFHVIQRLDLISSNPNPIIRHFSPTWRTIKKVVDIPYIVRAMFHQSTLPMYEITLAKNDRVNLLNNLPNYPEQNRLFEEFKDTVKAEFRHGSYQTTDAKMRYRGVSPNHWYALKKSWQVNLPNDQPLGDRTTLRFTIGRDKGWIKAVFWHHVASKLNLMSPESEAVKLRVNKKDMGVYLLLEGWEESFFEKRNRQFYHLLSDRDIEAKGADLLRPEQASALWYDRFEEDLENQETFEPLIYMLTLAAYATDDVFEKEIGNILDMDSFYRWILTTSLGGNFHQGNAGNLLLYFNPASGKFESILFDTPLVAINETIDISNHRIVNRIISNTNFRKQFEEIVRSYVRDDRNLENDLDFYDKETVRIIQDIYLDTAKVQTSPEARAQIKRERDAYEYNYLKLQSWLNTQGTLSYKFANEAYPLNNNTPKILEKFNSFRMIANSRDEFLKEYPQFVRGADPNIVILLPGYYIFTKDVVIPKNLKVIIRENITVKLGSGVSIISYSPVEAHGTQASQIVMMPLIENSPWGVFGVVNTSSKSTFQNVHMIGGKDDTVNGIYFSGMLSLHNADAEFQSGSVEKAGADDGLHALNSEIQINKSTFINNKADSVDIDFSENNSIITNNTFLLDEYHKKDSNGDAIDLSFSSAPITSNNIEQCSDKGISIGEASSVTVTNNFIMGCTYGVAVKDKSIANIENNVFKQNQTAIGLYRKKPHFQTGGTASLSGNKFYENENDTSVDQYSHLTEP